MKVKFFKFFFFQKSLGNKNRMLRNDLITLREKLKTYQKAKRKAKRRGRMYLT